jgi:hypothetical protein
MTMAFAWLEARKFFHRMKAKQPSHTFKQLPAANITVLKDHQEF